MLCLGIIWNCVQDFKTSIIEDINQQGEILATYDLFLGDEYDSFVRYIYSKEIIDEWKIDKKISSMYKSSDRRDVTLVFVKMDVTEKYYHKGKRKMVYASLDRLKRSIREKYSQLVPEYFFDNVFHLTDDENEFKACMGIFDFYVQNSDFSSKVQKQKVKTKK